MLNIGNKGSGGAAANAEARRRYIDDTGQMFVRYGSALTLGRLFALLLISEEPLSLDDMAEDLGVSKSGASVAARDLERLGIARRQHTRGSRRVLYAANEELDPIFDASLVRIREGLYLMQRAEGVVPEGKTKERLRQMAQFYEFWLQETSALAERWKKRRAD